MLANISPCISILLRKWLSGFEAAWSSIAGDSQPGCHCPLDQAGLVLTNPVHWGRDEDAPLSVPAGVWLFSWHSWWHLRRIVLGLVEFPAPVLEPSWSQGNCRCLFRRTFAAYWSPDLPVIYAGFGQPDPPTKVNCHRSSDFHISLNCTPATKHQWARGKCEKIHCLKHVLHFSIIFFLLSYIPLPVLWHTSAIPQGVFTCCYKFLFIPTVFNWHFESNVLSLWNPQQFCLSYSTPLAWSNCGCYCCHLPWVQVPNYGSPGSSCSLTIISYLCICSASVQPCQQWKKWSWLNWEPHS